MSSFGQIFRVSTFGESHCKGVGAIVDGVPPRMCAAPAPPLAPHKPPASLAPLVAKAAGLRLPGCASFAP